MKIAAYIWCVLSVTSLAFYAFTGQAFWEPLNQQTDGVVRFMLLFMLHLGGPLAVLAAYSRRAGRCTRSTGE